MMTDQEMRVLAREIVVDHGLPLVLALERDNVFDGGNLVALLEIFGKKLLKAAKAAA